MKWSFDSEATRAVASIMALRTRFGRTQQLMALVLSLALCAFVLLAVSGRMNLTPASTAQPSTLPAVGLAATADVSTSVPLLIPSNTVPASSTQPQTAKFNCGTGTAETRYVADRSGAIVFDRADANQAALGTLPYRNSVQAYGTVPGRMTGNSDKWFAVRYGERCAYIWADPASSRLSTTRPP
jgi:hypothetical protein